MPDTLTTLHDVLATWEVEHQAQRDPTQATPSDLGALCLRQVAFRINGRSATDETEPVTVATVGTLIHAGLALIWDDDPAVIATEVAFPEGGHADVLRVGEIRDTKTLSRSKFDAWREHDGPPAGVWQQLAVYAARASRTGGTVEIDGDVVGIPPQKIERLVIDALCRETGRCATYVMAYTEARGAQAEGALVNLADDLRGVDPLDVDTEHTGRGDWLCDACPFLTACVGSDDRPIRSPLDVAEVEGVLASYANAREAERVAVAAKEAARARLEGVLAGDYGAWRLGWSKPKEAVDWKEARRLLVEDFGVGLPLKVDPEGQPITTVTIQVVKA